MSKSVYSLVLDDAVVSQLDGMAARQGMSRSAIINELLAKHIGHTTRDTGHRDAVEVVEQAAVTWGMRGSISSGGTLTLRTALRYKYNPAISYILELFEEKDGTIGELRVSLRSTNETLLIYMGLFFRLWNTLEQQYLPVPPGEEHHTQEAKRYIRRLRTPPKANEEPLGEMLADYVSLMDECLKVYFSHLGDATLAVQKTEEHYGRELKTIGAAAYL